MTTGINRSEQAVPIKLVGGLMASLEQFPRSPVAPTIASVPAGLLLADSVTGTIEQVRMVVNPGDDNTAAIRLAAGTPECYVLLAGDAPDDLVFQVDPDGVDGEITDVYLLAVGNGGTDAGGDNIVDSSTVINRNAGATVGTVAMPDVSDAEILAATNMVHLEFAAVDLVRDFTARLGRTFDSGTQAWLSVVGRSYA